MTVYVVTGKLGSGKSVAAVGKIRDYMKQGRKVATNLDLFTEHLVPHQNQITPIRLPDKPRSEDLELIGTGSGLLEHEYNEDQFGLLVLDELGTWFNSRNWNDKGRADLINWFVQARKYHWDLLLLVQDVESIDKQLRDSLCEHLVVCRRLDRISVPFISPIAKLLTGYRVTLPRMHMASVFYGQNTQALRVDRWLYRGKDLYPAYRTAQKFRMDEQIINGQFVDMRATYTMLSAYHLRGRYMETLKQRIADFFIRAINVIIRKLDSRISARSAQPGGQRLTRLVLTTYNGDIHD